MVATVAYLIVGVGVVGAAAYYFFFTPHNSNIQATVKVEDKSSAPKGPNQNLLLDGAGDVEDADDSDKKALKQLEKGNFKRAAEYFEISKQVYQEKGGHDFMLAEVFSNLGDCYAKTGESDRALENYKSALNIFDHHPANLSIQQKKRVLLGYATVLRKNGDEKQAKDMEDKANSLKVENPSDD